MRKTLFAVYVLLVVFILGACSRELITMPYGSREYRNEDWTAESLVEHFQGLGFTRVYVENTETRYGDDMIDIYNVKIEDTEAVSVLTEYMNFDGGDSFYSNAKIMIETHTYIPTISVENSPEFKALCKSQNADMVKEFMTAHSGEYLEFNAKLSKWLDNNYAERGASFRVSVETGGTISMEFMDLKIEDLHLEECQYSNYYEGMITDETVKQGIYFHMVARIVTTESGAIKYEICQTELLPGRYW